VTRSNTRRPLSAALNDPQQASSELSSLVSFEGLPGTLGLAEGGGGDATSQLPVLSPRNSACLLVPVATALFLTGTLGSSRFVVLEALQSADHVLTIHGTAPPGPGPLVIGAVAGTPSKRGGT
jgi:hypothetical protein